MVVKIYATLNFKAQMQKKNIGGNYFLQPIILAKFLDSKVP